LSHLPIEETDVFKIFDKLSDEVWGFVMTWNPLAKDVVGKQLLRSLDSVGANLVEGDGRYSDGEAIHFFEYARGSAREARFWLKKAEKRGLVQSAIAKQVIDEVETGTKMLNSLISYRRKTKNQGVVREESAVYEVAPSAQRPTPNAILQSHGGEPIL